MNLPSYHRLIGLFLYTRKKNFFFYIGFPTGGGLAAGPPPPGFLFKGFGRKNTPCFSFRHFCPPKIVGPEKPKIRQKIFSGVPRAPQRPWWGREKKFRARTQNIFFDFFLPPCVFPSRKWEPRLRRNTGVFPSAKKKKSEKKLGKKLTPAVEKNLKNPFRDC